MSLKPLLLSLGNEEISIEIVVSSSVVTGFIDVSKVSRVLPVKIGFVVVLSVVVSSLVEVDVV